VEKEPRKATDVLLDIENKMDMLLSMIRSQDLNLKLLSNKLNIVMEKLEKQTAPTNKIIVEAVNTVTPNIPIDEKNIPVSPENSLPIETSPQGFRRTSRPETYSGDNSYIKKNVVKDAVVFPMQLPKMPGTSESDAEVVVPSEATNVVENFAPKVKKAEKPTKLKSDQHIPVMQRIVDKNGKSIFLAEIEIIDVNNSSEIPKTRTNGTGKWTASLPVGNYRVIVRKRESLTKEKVEVVQDIQVDGTKSPLELQTMILKI
jgi:hypothetical protein